MSTHKSSGNRTYFKEIQHPRKEIKWGVTLVLVGILVYLFNYTYQMYLGETSILGYSKKFKLLVLGDFVLTILFLGMLIIVWNHHFVIKVTRSSIYFKKPPLNTMYKKIHKDKMEEVEVASTDDLPDGTIKVKIKGKNGVLIGLEDGRDVFIGSQHPESLEKAVKKLIDTTYRAAKRNKTKTKSETTKKEKEKEETL
jgi:hypothetical protein